MGVVQLSDEIEYLIDQELAACQVADRAAFVELAVLHYLADLTDEADEIEEVVRKGIAAIEAGNYVTVYTAEDEQALRHRLTERMQATYPVAE